MAFEREVDKIRKCVAEVTAKNIFTTNWFIVTRKISKLCPTATSVIIVLLYVQQNYSSFINQTNEPLVEKEREIIVKNSDSSNYV